MEELIKKPPFDTYYLENTKQKYFCEDILNTNHGIYRTTASCHDFKITAEVYIRKYQIIMENYRSVYKWTLEKGYCDEGISSPFYRITWHYINPDGSDRKRQTYISQNNPDCINNIKCYVGFIKYIHFENENEYTS
jgi:hypothetical protein